MRVVVQRVSEARVEVGGEVVGEIERGLMVLAGCGEGDEEDDARWLADKIANLRVFEDEDGKMNLSVLEIGGSVLLVPNFTLYGDCRKGRRPSFTGACDPGIADGFMDVLADRIAGTGLTVERGEFGAHMHVSLTNDGPVTLLLSSDRTF
ncbi:MAG: D-tyrosyl-tRNA(Tyr) deacylase [Armatimonadia bacterium]|nr:D-tyrosyl-tRNA(Tyr) deacylase [Armatimonadia bacterium]